MAAEVEKPRKMNLETAYNVRSFAGYRTKGGAKASDRLLRGDCLLPMSGRDARALASLGLSHVVDLRSEGEIKKVPSIFASYKGVDYRNVPLISNAEAEIQTPENFTMAMLYIDLLQNVGPAILTVFKTIAAAAAGDGKLLFHCTAGKDRTGLIAALLLDLAGADDETIVRDYTETGENMAPVMDILRENSGVPASMAHFTDEILSARAKNMEDALGFLYSAYGGASGYLAGIGLAAEETGAIIEMLTERE